MTLISRLTAGAKLTLALVVSVVILGSALALKAHTDTTTCELRPIPYPVRHFAAGMEPVAHDYALLYADHLINGEQAPEVPLSLIIDKKNNFRDETERIRKFVQDHVTVIGESCSQEEGR